MFGFKISDLLCASTVSPVVDPGDNEAVSRGRESISARSTRRFHRRQQSARKSRTRSSVGSLGAEWLMFAIPLVERQARVLEIWAEEFWHINSLRPLCLTTGLADVILEYAKFDGPDVSFDDNSFSFLDWLVPNVVIGQRVELRLENVEESIDDGDVIFKHQKSCLFLYLDDQRVGEVERAHISSSKLYIQSSPLHAKFAFSIVSSTEERESDWSPLFWSHIPSLATTALVPCVRENLHGWLELIDVGGSRRVWVLVRGQYVFVTKAEQYMRRVQSVEQIHGFLFKEKFENVKDICVGGGRSFLMTSNVKNSKFRAATIDERDYWVRSLLDYKKSSEEFLEDEDVIGRSFMHRLSSAGSMI